MAELCRCVDCGLLGTRHDRGQLDEVDERSRENGKPAQEHVAPLLCCARRTTFSRKGEEAREQFCQERSCNDFIPWHPGLTPKEHLDQMHNNAFLAVQAALASNHEALLNFQAERAAAAKARDAAQAARDAAQAARDAAQTAHEASQREAAEESRRLLKFDMLVKALAPIVATVMGVILGWFLRGPSVPIAQPAPPPVHADTIPAK